MKVLCKEEKKVSYSTRCEVDNFCCKKMKQVFNEKYKMSFDDGSGNHWNSSGNETLNYVSSGEGNYWSDYSGIDNDGDGIGDTSYQIPGIANAEDSYPVMVPNFFEFY